MIEDSSIREPSTYKEEDHSKEWKDAMEEEKVKGKECYNKRRKLLRGSIVKSPTFFFNNQEENIIIITKSRKQEAATSKNLDS